jgi:penicillin-binding protein 1A
MKSLLRVLYHTFLVGFSLLVLVMMLLVIYVGDSLSRLPDSLSDLRIIQPTRIYDCNNQLLMEYGESIHVELEQISPAFIQTLLTVEDQQFYNHHGINKPRLIMISLKYLLAGGRKGASTLTQQLVKNYFLSFDKTVSRKFEEILTAFQFELRYSKDEILSAYCNTVNFGGNKGVELAAQSFFGKHAAQLDYLESAVLVAMLKASTRYSPRSHPELSRQRRDLILKLLMTNGVIDETLLAELSERDTEVLPQELRHGYLRDYLRLNLTEETNSADFSSTFFDYAGASIYTTIDLELQQAAERVLATRLQLLGERLANGADDLLGCFVAVHPYSGGILVMQGGSDYSKSQLNLTTRAHRQPGSGIKPFLYYTALEQGLSPRDIISDSSRVFDIGYGRSWSPGNWDGKYLGPMILKQGFMKSRNTIAAQVGDSVGVQGLVELGKQLHFARKFEAQPALALGAAEVTPLEMAAAYAALVNSGYYTEPYVVRRIEDDRGNILYEEDSKRERVMDPQTAYLVVDMLQDAVNQGTGSLIRRLGYKGTVGGKTGTTNNYHDSWFNGITPWLVSSLWVGYDRADMYYTNSSRGVTGAGGALPVFADFLLEVGAQRDEGAAFRIPAGITFKQLDVTTGEEVAENSPNSLRVALRQVDY